MSYVSDIEGTILPADDEEAPPPPRRRPHLVAGLAVALAIALAIAAVLAVRLYRAHQPRRARRSSPSASTAPSSSAPARRAPGAWWSATPPHWTGTTSTPCTRSPS